VSSFESITTAQVRTVFALLGCAPAIAETLARVCTLGGALPPASSASPLLVNAACRSLDRAMETLARGQGCVYTRYADDLTFSGATLPPATAITAVLAEHGFRLRDGRCRIQRRGRAQYVTGLTVFDGVAPRVARAVKRRLRLALYYMAKYVVADHVAHTSPDAGARPAGGAGTRAGVAWLPGRRGATPGRPAPGPAGCVLGLSVRRAMECWR